MDVPFDYGHYVTGKNFIGRAMECQVLGNLISQSENIAIYEPPKTGKKSLIQQTLLTLRTSGRGVTALQFNALNIRTVADFMLQLGSMMIEKAADTPEGYASIVGVHLAGTHFVFDPVQYRDHGKVLSLNWDIDDADIRAIFRLPYALSATMDRLLVIIDEFQNVMLTEDGERIIRAMVDVLKSVQSDPDRKASYLMCGSEVNAMAEIFDVRKFFYRLAVRVELQPHESKDLIDYVTKNLLSKGKVIDRDLLLGACRLFRNKAWYVIHLAAICDALSRGYIMEPILNEALDSMIAVHQPRFEMMMNDLTTFQVSMLKAVLDGHKKFSSTEVISQYGLNTSANVKRLREALAKKEIVFFGEDQPVVLDPLFEYWVRKFYFKMEI